VRLHISDYKHVIHGVELPRHRVRLIIRAERLDVGPYLSTERRKPLAPGRAMTVDSPIMTPPEPSEPARRLAREPSDESSSITALLEDLRAGRREAFDQIVPLVYDRLRRAARRELAARPSDTLFTTALVHELYLKFSRSPHSDWADSAHFLRAAAVAMRHILVDRARRRTADKRGGAQHHVTFDDAATAVDDQAASLLELHEALDHLATLDERLARVVECRFFGGMTELETAEALGITERTVRRDWVKARALLFQILRGERESATPADRQAVAR
jgi:RNA polymerase sigma factor (TIGR02999 family)